MKEGRGKEEKEDGERGVPLYSWDASFAEVYYPI